RVAAHRRERHRRPAKAGDEVEEAAGGARAVAGDDEQGSVRVLARDRVHRHREAALRLTVTPALRHRLELAQAIRIQLLGRDQLGSIALALEPVNGLPDLADGPAVEREGARLHDRLVTEVERA